jgi:hypothetical protein
MPAVDSKKIGRVDNKNEIHKFAAVNISVLAVAAISVQRNSFNHNPIVKSGILALHLSVPLGPTHA